MKLIHESLDLADEEPDLIIPTCFFVLRTLLVFDLQDPFNTESIEKFTTVTSINVTVISSADK